MEKKQLDLNAPLLSVRRFSSPTHSSELVKRKVIEMPLPSRQQSLPLFKSEWECEEVTKPAAVPFHWEQIPGRPKDDVDSRTQSPRRSSSTPRLPPVRVSDALRRNSGEATKLPPERSSAPSRYNSGDQNIYRPQVEAFSFSDHASLLEKLNESLNCNDSDSESGDDMYSDALDTLSPTESWSMNYSVSGVSGCHSSDVKPSGTFSIDTQTRDYMMNRFLPAAKAVVLETPQYVVKKPPVVVNEQPKQIKKVVSKELKPPVRPHRSQTMPYYSQEIVDAESDGEDREIRAPVKKWGKTWGILPKFCVKNALCLFNPLPGMKSKPHTPTPSPGRVQRLTRNAHSGPLDKNACHVPQKKKFHSGLLLRDLQEIDNNPTIDLNHFLNSRESYRSEVSPLRRYRSGNISPFRNESPRSPFHEGMGFLGMPKQVENYNTNNKIASSRKLFKALQDVSRTPISERRLGNDGQTVLQTGSLHKVVLPFPKSSPSRHEGYEVVLPIPKSSPNRKTGHVVGESKQESDSNERELDPPPKSPLPPPLPKSPSESWLWRTLPSIPLGNPFSAAHRRNHIHPKDGHKASSIDAKWETIVKTSKMRHDHVRYSEELGALGSH